MFWGKHVKLTMKLFVFVLICCFSLSAQAKYGGGTGEPNDPYLIYTAEQMNAIGADSNDWNKHFLLCADIDLSGFTGTSFNIIGYYVNYNDKKPFIGVFDGNGHTIYNFSYDSNGVNYIGLFGFVNDPNAEIRNLGLIDPNVDAGTKSWAVGSLVAYLRVGTITNCYVEGGSVLGDSSAGGLVGSNWVGKITNCYSNSSVMGGSSVGGLVGQNSGTIINCYSYGSVSGVEDVGGLVGYNYLRTIIGCYSTGVVSGDDNVGGLVGLNDDNGTISNCYSAGSVSGGTNVGGLVGMNARWYISSTIRNCYSSGSVTGGSFVGGLVGDNGGTITNCYSTASVSGGGGLVGYGGGVFGSYWDTETSGQITSAGGIGKTTVEMKMASTFVYWGACGEAWTIDEGVDYPRLVWEEKPGEPIVSLFPLQGEGDSDSPYLIHTPEELNVIGLLPCVWHKHFLLCADIDLSGYTGTSFNIIGNFIGIFDGNGFEISNFTYTSTGTGRIGLFGYVNGGLIRNLGLITPEVDAGTGSYVGSLVGRLGNGTITNCYVEGGRVSGRYYVGGLVGRNGLCIIVCNTCDYSGTISNCHSTGSVHGDYGVGGLVGDNSGTISDCYSTASVSGYDYVGGMAGINDSYGTISNSYSMGSVSGISGVGGLVGTNVRFIDDEFDPYGVISNCCSTGSVSGKHGVGGFVGENYSIIYNCYSEGSVTGNGSVGGLVGRNGEWEIPGRITYCYSTGSVSGTSSVGGGGLVGYNERYSMVSASFWDIETSGQLESDGGTGLPTADMQMESTFIDACWDFVNIWDICEGTNYPRFIWQILVGDFLCPDGVNFADFSFFAGHWAEDNCGATNDCEGTDLDQLGTVDINDLAIFVGNWLAGPPPGQAINPNPADGATGVDIDADLSWKPGYRAILHEVYFGIDPHTLPLVATQPVGQEIYDPPGDLIRSTTYYWCIDEVGDYSTVTGTVWSFTTIPGEAHTPSPADGTLIPGREYEYPPDSGNWYIYTELDFVPGPTADPDPIVRRAYFSKNRDDVANRVQDANLGPPPFAQYGGIYERTYYVGHPEIPPVTDSLVRGKTYYWCVDETDADGHTYPGGIWEFTIRGFYAFAPNPPNEAVLVDPNVVLSWSEGYGVQEHDIYLGTSWDDVNNADVNDITGIYRGHREVPNYPCSNLELNTKFYWRVDEVIGRGPPLFIPEEFYKGDVWCFTTGGLPLP